MPTRLSDHVFFTQLLDTTLPGLGGIPAAAKAGDFAACRRMYAAYFRGSLDPATYFSAGRTLDEDDPETEASDLARAEKALGNVMCSVGEEFDFGEKGVDWYANPTYNGYREWTWQLNRHAEWKALAAVYRRTGDEKYAACAARQIRSWIDQATAPVSPCFSGETLAWRTIECGIRQGQVWPEVIHSFVGSPAFDDDLITDWCKSTWEHGSRLRLDHGTYSNWLIMEMTGLVHVGLLYPGFRYAGEWYEHALEQLMEQLDAQVYADGYQYELSTGYQVVLLKNYAIVMRLLAAYGREVPARMRECMQKMMRIYVWLMRPDGKVPDINDGAEHRVSQLLSQYIDLVPDDALLRWAVTEGREGEAPDHLDHVFDVAGHAVLRTGWGAADTWLFFDGGKYGTAHQHEDKLGLLLYADGRPILTECGIYAYDGSEMRKYCLSTRGHNTIRVDGLDQNQWTGFDWKQEVASKHDLQVRLSGAVDALRASYAGGYGEARDRSVRHERRVYFFRKLAGLRPFVVVADRLSADVPHDYEVIWHLDTRETVQSGMHLRAETLNLFMPEAENAALTVVCGQTEPEYQGWYSACGNQNRHRPIDTALCHVQGQNLRWVTVLYPDGGEGCPIVGVDASQDAAATAVTLRMRDGTVLELEEVTVGSGQ